MIKDLGVLVNVPIRLESEKEKTKNELLMEENKEHTSIQFQNFNSSSGSPKILITIETKWGYCCLSATVNDLKQAIRSCDIEYWKGE